jgi:hypothetical protein
MDLENLKAIAKEGDIKGEVVIELINLLQGFQQPEVASPENTAMQLSELIRGFEIPPSASELKPYQLYLIGKAIAEQAKEHPEAMRKPEGKLIASGQGLTPEEACQIALTAIAKAVK